MGHRFLISMRAMTAVAAILSIAPAPAEGQPLPGFTFVDAAENRGDEIAHIVSWQAGSAVGALANKPVRLLFALDRVDLYSFRFE